MNQIEDLLMRRRICKLAPIVNIPGVATIVWGVARIRFTKDKYPERQPDPQPMSAYAQSLLEELFRKWN